jgi:RecA/RadA recombinase
MSPITFSGSSPNILSRFITGYKSLDLALSDKSGNFGLPGRTILELYGFTGSGKSTLAWTLAAKISKKIALADLEGFSPEYMKVILQSAGFDENGEVIFRQDESDEKVLDLFEKDILTEEVQAGVVDSIGAINPISELESTMAEVSMGRRARLVAKLSRRLTHDLRFKKNPTTIFLINHCLAIIGGRGTATSGGDVMKYLASIRIRVSKQEMTENGDFIIEGKVEKNRYGIQNAKFQVYYLSGKGIHQGLTAANDCIYLNLASSDRVVKMDGKSYGFWKRLVAGADDPEIFQPFIDKIKNNTGEIKHVNSNIQESTGDS